ncbi:MAG: transcriptional regulator [Acidobacteriia bacterium]|nr:transcriptional regulator [Terriglobia bacterium]
MNIRALRIPILVLLVLAAGLASAQQWKPLGPDGGDVRSFAYDPRDPNRVFLGTSAGRLYLSTDGGMTWSRYAHLGNSSDMVLDNIVIDPTNSRIIYVAAWSVESSTSGDLFRSLNGGRSWDVVPDLHGKSIRALALAPSNPRVLVAGALDGVFRSRDGGDSWQRISPENHAEIKNVESVAIDPGNPDIIYAGTWHLPWKTEDGGKTWHNIKNGVIEDSDVFSIIIDPVNPSVVFASACSGIYKSETGGDQFHKIQGIPFSARRTRVLQMDSIDHKIVYAGTTEGLWKTVDAGATWKRMTANNIIVNDVLVDPGNSSRVLLATDRGGVLASNDGGASFAPSNSGFAHRQVTSVVADRSDSSVLYAGLINDKEFGGVFVSRDAGLAWRQISEGLEGRDVFVLRQTDGGSLIAGTNRGIFKLVPGNNRWQPISTLDVVRSKTVKGAGGRMTMTSRVMEQFGGRVSGLELGSEKWYAATSSGILSSTDHGRSWHEDGPAVARDLIGISAFDQTVVAAGRRAIFLSSDGGATWKVPALSNSISIVNSVGLDHEGGIWIGAREGLFRTTNEGQSWDYIGTLPLADIVAIDYDSEDHRLLATGAASTSIYESSDSGRTWHRRDSGWLLRDLHPVHGRVFAATAFDGVVVEPNPQEGLRQVSSGGNK